MNSPGKTIGTWERLGLISILALLSSIGPSVKAGVYLYENFDGQLPAPMIGWSGGGVVGPMYDYVSGVGVNGTVAMQESATWVNDGNFNGYVGMLYQNPLITGNAGATRANTMLAFDLKANVPDIYGFSVDVQSWKGGWSGTPTASTLDLITLPDPPPADGPPWPGYDLPQEFRTFALAVGDPRWYEDQYPPTPNFWQGQFDPAGDVYQTFFQMNAGLSLPLYFGQTRLESLTVDNLRFWTVIDDLVVTPAVLWSPNHKMVAVTVDYTLSDGGGVDPVVSSELSVTSNEPINGLGDGDTSPDWQIIDAHHVLLRAERSGKGDGRVYTITVNATDTLGNSLTRSTTVTVPKSQSR
jgi:hypothetical protein